MPAHTQPPTLTFTPVSIKHTRSRKVSHAQILPHMSNVLCWYTTLRYFIIFYSPGMKISAFHWTFPKRSPRPRGKRGRNGLVSRRASRLKAARGAGGEGRKSFLRLPLGVATTLMQQRLRQEQKQVQKKSRKKKLVLHCIAWLRITSLHSMT